jgi:hypothetical protein
MSVLEVLQTFPTQQKSLLSALGVVDPADTQLITFDLDSGEPRLPALVAFQIPIKIRNITVHHCIIDEGVSTCIMSKSIWQKLGSPELIPSSITSLLHLGQIPTTRSTQLPLSILGRPKNLGPPQTLFHMMSFFRRPSFRRYCDV